MKIVRFAENNFARIQPCRTSIMRRKLSKTVFLALGLTWFQLIIVLPPTVEALSCLPCDTERCPRVLDCDGGTTVDVCGCCLECARVLNDTCGGPYFMYGKCDEGLVCVITPAEDRTVNVEEIGVCKEIPSHALPSSNFCDDVDCPDSADLDMEDSYSSLEENQISDLAKSSALPCPHDSVAVTSKTRPGQSLRLAECCGDTYPNNIPATPGASACRCHPCSPWSVAEGKDDHSGQDGVSHCEPGFIRILKSEGLGVPGQCCDVFDCVEHTIFCEHVECEEDLAFPPICPDDSNLLPALITQDGCCFVQQGCSCKPKDSCPKVECAGGLQKRMKKLGTGVAGSCCDEYDCINGSNPICKQNGTVYHDGDKWQIDSCTTCECRGSLIFCQPVECPAVPVCSWMGTPEGECCPVCKGCVSQAAELYANGAVWKQDSCVTCHCSAGQVYCQAQMCSPGCINPKIVPGECCPVCDDPPIPTLPIHCPELSNCTLMCLYGYVMDKNGCYQCTCLEDYDTNDCDLECPHGYKMDDKGNQLCECVKPLTPEVRSPTLPTSNSDHSTPSFTEPSSTAFSTTFPSSSASSSKASDFSTTPAISVKVSEAAEPALSANTTDNPAETAAQFPELSANSSTVTRYITTSPTTSNSRDNFNSTTLPPSISSILCPPMAGCSRQCSYGYKLDDFGCPICRCYKCPPFDCTKKCLMGYALNEEGCRLCKCLDTGFVETTSSAVTPWLLPLGGRHCSSVDGQRMDEGQSWWDGCRKCFCHEGHEMCALITCPTLRCTNPIMRVGSCCLSCPGEDVGPVGPLGTSACYSADGRYFVEGETWLLDECTQCICHQGAALCAIDSCPPVLCNHPVVLPHSCCPICPGNSGQLIPSTPWKDSQRKICRSSSGKYYGSGDTWRVNDCQSCACRDGQIHCYFQTCPVLPCTKIIHKKGQCCPLCMDAREKTCSHSGDIYSVNENWIIDDCTKCTCVESGQVLCTVSVCESQSQTGSRSDCQLVRQPGLCCPVCLEAGYSNRTGGHLDLPNKSLSITIHPAILVLAIAVILLALIIVLLLVYRRRRTRRYWLPSPDSTVMMTSGSLAISGTSRASSSSQQRYSVAPSLGKTTPISCGTFDGCCTAETSPSTMRESTGDFTHADQYSTNPYSTSTVSTKLSMSSSDSIKRPDSVSSLCDVVVKDDKQFDEEEGDASCNKLDDLIDTFPSVYIDKSADNEFSDCSADNRNNEKLANNIEEGLTSSSASTIDIKDKRNHEHDDDDFSDEATDSATDFCFESSKQLIDKKRKNRRSAGDELERQADRRLLMSPLGVPSERSSDENKNLNRRSW